METQSDKARKLSETARKRSFKNNVRKHYHHLINTVKLKTMHENTIGADTQSNKGRETQSNIDTKHGDYSHLQTVEQGMHAKHLLVTITTMYTHISMI